MVVCLECPTIEMDAVFLIDGFIGSSDQAFASTKQFLMKFVRSFDVGTHLSQFAVLQYTSRQR